MRRLCSRHAVAGLLCALVATVARAQPEEPTESAPPDPSSADAPTITARTESTGTIEVGDPIRVVITSIAPTRVAVNLPTQLDLGPFSLLAKTQSETDLGDGRMRRDFVLTVAAFEPGEWTLPSIALTYLGPGGAVRSAPSPALAITVTSLLANEPEPELRPDSSPVEVREERLWPLYTLGGLLALGLGVLLGGLIMRRVRAGVARPAPPPRPAHEVAFERLDRLAAGLDPNADLRPFYFQLSEIVRDYLGGRFGFDSLEMTTPELIAELDRRARRELVLGEIEGWLSACDLVKFARVAPSAPEAREALEGAIRIVSSTRPRPSPQGEPVAPAPEVSLG